MTNTNTMTRAQELAAIMTFAHENGYEGSTAKLEKVLEQWTAKRERSNQPTKTAMENMALAKAALEAMPQGEAVTNQWISEHVNGIMTSNKSAVIMGILIEHGKVSKCKVGKVMTYTKL